MIPFQKSSTSSNLVLRTPIKPGNFQSTAYLKSKSPLSKTTPFAPKKDLQASRSSYVSSLQQQHTGNQSSRQNIVQLRTKNYSPRIASRSSEQLASTAVIKVAKSPRCADVEHQMMQKKNKQTLDKKVTAQSKIEKLKSPEPQKLIKERKSPSPIAKASIELMRQKKKKSATTAKRQQSKTAPGKLISEDVHKLVMLAEYNSKEPKNHYVVIDCLNDVKTLLLQQIAKEKSTKQASTVLQSGDATGDKTPRMLSKDDYVPLQQKTEIDKKKCEQQMTSGFEKAKQHIEPFRDGMQKPNNHSSNQMIAAKKTQVADTSPLRERSLTKFLNGEDSSLDAVTNMRIQDTQDEQIIDLRCHQSKIPIQQVLQVQSVSQEMDKENCAAAYNADQSPMTPDSY